MLYCCYVADDSNFKVAQQQVDQTWRRFSLLDIWQSVGCPVGDDNHNSPAIGVDGDGYIHIAANMHDTLMRYIRSTTANDISAWTHPAMIDTEESSVTYPAFLRLPDGRLSVMYRDGASGSGQVITNRYDPVTTTWTRLATPLLSGSDNSGPIGIGSP